MSSGGRVDSSNASGLLMSGLELAIITMIEPMNPSTPLAASENPTMKSPRAILLMGAIWRKASWRLTMICCTYSLYWLPPTLLMTPPVLLVDVEGDVGLRWGSVDLRRHGTAQVVARRSAAARTPAARRPRRRRVRLPCDAGAVDERAGHGAEVLDLVMVR